jgi:branched-chain amino acid transport system permease protein
MRVRAGVAPLAIGVGFAVILYLLPLVLAGSPYMLFALTLTLCYAIPAVALNLLLGYTGLVSLGHMGFAGIGAYVTAVLMKDGIVPFAPAIAAGTIAAGIAGAMVGVPCLRLRSHFFIIVTLAVGLMLYLLFNNLDWLTGGAAGLPGVPRPGPINLGFAIVDPRRPVGFYFLAVTIFLLVFMIQYALVYSDFGRSLAAIRQDETLAASRGVDVFAHKLTIFALSAAIAGLGGGLQVEFLRAAAPQSYGFLENVNLVLIVIVGGAGSLFGPTLGALLFIALPEVLRIADTFRMIIFGAALLALALFAPRGLWGLAVSAFRKLRRRDPALSHASHP